MKAASVFSVAACLLLALPALGSETPPAADLFLEESASTVGQDCEPTLDLEAALGMPDPTFAAINCGACSSSNCVGVPRGTRCHLGPFIGGSGWCNIYSGGFMCPTGGWECSCGTGPLP